MKALDDILGKKTVGVDDAAEAAAEAELYAFTAEPETYRPFLTRSRPQMGVSLITVSGARHGFAYFTLRYLMHEVRGSEEFLSFTSDAIAVVMQGSGLLAVYNGLLRHSLAEVREYDGKPVAGAKSMITRLTISDTAEKKPLLQLVK